ncbi:hypothetical protein CYMTET_54635 [Cymbomonas tetramitiformis]|uniref:Carboxypeptidase n=1 Tax=Cymbomonas tetramitiformis TaxID=36881 RepID=A0AAE0BEI7_9CHLO|nr:hypothetical protein CYMTET_54635 [Cymbomonas tetramitiformis]
MWIDQPTGVGFSYGDASDYDHNEKEVADDMFHFMQAWYGAHQEFLSNKFFVFGESYGGHYVPNVANRIFQGNQAKEGTHVNLAGFAVGNGLTDPEIQYAYYAEMANNNTYGIKAVSDSVYEKMVKAQDGCINKIKACQKLTIACTFAQASCNNDVVAPYEKTGLNPYDIRKPCGENPLCYDFSSVTKFLDLDSTRQALHVTSKSAKWESCNYKVNSDFSSDWMKNYQGQIPPMLEGGVRGLIYAGDADYICNWMGNKAWSLALNWSGSSKFRGTPDQEWTVDSKAAGKVRSADGFTFLQVYGAGHMVPMDQPLNALTMLNTFIHGEEF